MTRRFITSGSTFEAETGYSRRVVDGDWVFVSGTTGFDYQTMTIAEGIAEQTERASGTSPPRSKRPGRHSPTSSG